MMFSAKKRQVAMRATVQKVMRSGDARFGDTAARLREAVEGLDRATSHMLKTVAGNRPEDALAGATPYLRLFALAQGGAALAEAALASHAAAQAGDGDPARIVLARFFAENLCTGARGLEDTVIAGSGFVQDAPLALAS